jgi:hypothetical protein
VQGNFLWGLWPADRFPGPVDRERWAPGDYDCHVWHSGQYRMSLSEMDLFWKEIADKAGAKAGRLPAIKE